MIVKIAASIGVPSICAMTLAAILTTARVGDFEWLFWSGITGVFVSLVLTAIELLRVIWANT